MGNEDEDLLGFPWRGGADRETTGIMMWSKPFLIRLPSEEQVSKYHHFLYIIFFCGIPTGLCLHTFIRSIKVEAFLKKSCYFSYISYIFFYINIFCKLQLIPKFNCY